MSGSKPGERRGGRQKGTPNKRTVELIERAEASGITMPADMMLALAKDAYERWLLHRDPQTGLCLVPTWREGAGEEPEKIEIIDWGKRAMGYAAECAPYYHPTMKAIEATHDVTDTFEALVREIVRGTPSQDDQDQDS